MPYHCTDAETGVVAPLAQLTLGARYCVTNGGQGFVQPSTQKPARAGKHHASGRMMGNVGRGRALINIFSVFRLFCRGLIPLVSAGS